MKQITYWVFNILASCFIAFLILALTVIAVNAETLQRHNEEQAALKVQKEAMFDRGCKRPTHTRRENIEAHTIEGSDSIWLRGNLIEIYCTDKPIPEPIPEPEQPTLPDVVATQDDTAQHWVEILATNYSALQPNDGGETWIADGDSMIAVGVDSGSYWSLSDYDVSDSPQIDYRVNFTQSGKHYIWLEVLAFDDDSNSAHIGLNGVLTVSGREVANFPTDGQWQWASQQRATLTRISIDVPSPGVHTVNVWVREAGLKIRAIRITPDQSAQAQTGVSAPTYTALATITSPAPTKRTDGAPVDPSHYKSYTVQGLEENTGETFHLEFSAVGFSLGQCATVTHELPEGVWDVQFRFTDTFGLSSAWSSTLHCVVSPGGSYCEGGSDACRGANGVIVI